jgi:thiamine transport system permease protein
VTLPLLAPALSSAAAVVFLFCFTSFGIVLILGGPRYATLETEIYNQAARAFDLRTAAALALLQLAALTAAFTVAARLERRHGGARRRRGQLRTVPVGGQRAVVASVVVVSVALLLVPLAALVERSITSRRWRRRPRRCSSRRGTRSSTRSSSPRWPPPSPSPLASPRRCSPPVDAVARSARS